MPETNTKLDELREQIDSIDNDILSLLNQRAELSKQIGRIKKQFGIPVFSAKREEALIKNICSKSKGPLDKKAIERIFRLIMDESKVIQNQIVLSGRGSGE